MGSQFLSFIGGGAISLVSTLTVMFFRHRLDTRRLALEAKQYPFHVVYDKQTEFFDALAPVLLEMNCYITAIDMWAGETSVDAHSRAQEAMKNTSSLLRFDELLQRYYMYLPEKILEEANHLHGQCMLLSNSADTNKTYECINRLFAFQNMIRQFVGADALPKELFQALVPRVRKDKSAQQADKNLKS